jgi:glycosyltransferase involved in cell wall biosynthesis
MTLPITVIIPAHNRPEFLREAVESVKKQTVQPEEIIVVDDGSTPPITDLPGVRIITQANAGLPTARNSGIAAAKSEWLAFLDDDDIWEPDKLERQWQAIQRHPSVGIVFTDWLTFRDGEIINSSMLFAHSDQYVTPHHAEIREAFRLAGGGDAGGISYLANAPFSRGLVRYGPFVLPSSVMVRSDLTIACRGFDVTMPRTEDWDFWLRIAGRGASAAAVAVPLIRYRYHALNVSRDFVNAAKWIAHMAQKARDAKDAYPPGMDVFWEDALPFYVHRAARTAFKAGRFADARDLYGRLLKYRPTLSARLGAAAARLSDSSMGHTLYRSARRMKRAVVHAGSLGH